MSIDHVFAGIPVADYPASSAWYERLLGREPDLLPNDHEAAWKLTDSAWVYIVADAERAGRGLVTILVDDLDPWIAAGDETDVVGGMRRAQITDPDGNLIQMAAPLP